MWRRWGTDNAHYSYANPHCYSNANAATVELVNTNSNTNSATFRLFKPNSDADTNGNSDADTNGNSDADTNGNSDADSGTNSDTGRGCYRKWHSISIASCTKQ